MKKQPIKIKISFLSILMVITLFCTHSYISIAALLAAALHELGHITAARICNIPLKELKLSIFGASLTSSPMLCSFKNEIILCISGPMVNLISVFIFSPFLKSNNGFASLFIITSLFLGILNLLPIYEFDGGRILYCLLSLHLPLKTVTNIVKTVSFILIFMLWSLSVYLLLKLSSSISLFIFSLSLFSKIFLSPNENFQWYFMKIKRIFKNFILFYNFYSIFAAFPNFMKNNVVFFDFFEKIYCIFDEFLLQYCILDFLK